jgi:hypothetical protein
LSRDWRIWEAAFIVSGENRRMVDYVKALGAIEEEGRIFTLPIR